MTNITQMELGLNTAQRLANSLTHRQRRTSRAQWWFAQMRRAVDTALVWQPTPPCRPEQIWFKERKLSGQIDGREEVQHQVCE